jgi:hypothetical protein
MKPELPYWLVVLDTLTPLFAFLGTVAIGGFAAYIAHGQWRINKDKLKLDLYDRRLAVYEATMKFVLGLSGNAVVDADKMRQYLVATRQATFLFDDPSIPPYLKELATEAMRLDMAIKLTNKAAAGEIPQEIHPTAPETMWELLDWFLKQEKIIEKKFAPYLQLRG